MEFRDILVHMDNSPQCATRLELAVKLAIGHKAHLKGLYVVTHPHYLPQGEAVTQKVMQAQELFRLKTASFGIDCDYEWADWAVTGDSMVEILNHYAHRNDLVVVSQTWHDRLQENIPADLPERVVLGSGRPVLVVPSAGRFASAGERVVVAWKGGRASARAVHDAMPFLLKAKKVFVVTVASRAERHLPDTLPDDEISTHLRRHDIEVREEKLETGDLPADKVLMNFAWEHGCDLLVMGVPAQTARGALHLGPVAKLFFEHMTLPVMMSS